ncbi:MAG: hypothetical protein ACE366_05600 [Bradymonadia bacterium]
MSIIGRTSLSTSQATPLRLWPLAGLVLAATLISGVALGQEIYLNKVKVGGALTDRNFKNVEVHFDSEGNVHITAPGFQVQVLENAGEANASAAQTALKASGRHWMVVDVPLTGHYRVKTTLNGETVSDFSGKQAQHVIELTGQVVTGDNVLEMTFMPLPDAPSIANASAMKVVVGKGKEGTGDTLAIERLHGSLDIKSGQSSAFSKQIKFSAR